MNAEWRTDGLDKEEREAYLSENARVVEGMLKKYGSGHSTS
jgi:hypothetical protein